MTLMILICFERCLFGACNKKEKQGTKSEIELVFKEHACFSTLISAVYEYLVLLMVRIYFSQICSDKVTLLITMNFVRLP